MWLRIDDHLFPSANYLAVLLAFARIRMSAWMSLPEVTCYLVIAKS